jgi:ribonuclease P protein component
MSGSLAMIRSASDFAALQSGSRSRAHPLLVLRFRRNGLDSTRYGISTGRRIGGAVVRNRVRRRLRSLLRGLAGAVSPGYDVLIVARAPAAAATQAELGAALAKLAREAGLMEGKTSAT